MHQFSYRNIAVPPKKRITVLGLPREVAVGLLGILATYIIIRTSALIYFSWAYVIGKKIVISLMDYILLVYL